MQISKLEIKNFRLLKDVKIDVEDNLSLIIGKNNSGKTSILSLLKKCIKNDRRESQFEYHDFSIDFQNTLFDDFKKGKEYKIDKNYGIIMYMYVTYNEKDSLKNLKDCILDLDEKINTAIIKFEYTMNNDNFIKLIDDFNQYKNERTNIGKEEQAIEKKEIEKKLFLKFITKHQSDYFSFYINAVLPDENGKPIDEQLKKLDSINNIISLKYIDAKRDVSNIDKNRLSDLVNEYYKRISNGNSDTHLKALENSIDKTDDELTKIYDDLFKNLVDKISQFGGTKKNETIFNVISNIEKNNLLNNHTTVVYSNEVDKETYLPDNLNGLGYLNLISIIIIIETLLSEFRKDTEENQQPADINLLFIEEPEAHTHPQMQYIFIKNIKDLLKNGRKYSKGSISGLINLQTIMTTHSSHIVAESHFTDIKYLLKKDNKIEVKNLKDLKVTYEHKRKDNGNKTSKNQTEDFKQSSYFKFLTQNLNLGLAEIFFADKAILIEGDTERILLPAMMKKIDAEDNSENKPLPLLSQNISIITVGNYAHKYASFLEFIGIKVLIITDIDSCNSNGEVCETKEGTRIGKNIKKYFTNYFQDTTIENEIEVLKNLSTEDKLFSIGDEVSFQPNKEGNIFIAYQTEEQEYHARSFEDAFISINREFIIKHIDKFYSLQKTEIFYEEKNGEKVDRKDVSNYDLANKCITKKPSFAMDILMNSYNGDDTVLDWKIPAYIKEGLVWLKEN